MKSRELRKVNADDYLTSEEAAEELCIQPAAIRNYLHLGKLTTYKFKSLTLLKREEVEGWKGRKRNR